MLFKTFEEENDEVSIKNSPDKNETLKPFFFAFDKLGKADHLSGADDEDIPIYLVGSRSNSMAPFNYHKNEYDVDINDSIFKKSSTDQEEVLSKFNEKKRDDLDRTKNVLLTASKTENFKYFKQFEEEQLSQSLRIRDLNFNNKKHFSVSGEITQKADLDSFITSIQKNENIINNYKDDLKIKSLTNTEEIFDFYGFLQDCLVKIKKIVPASSEEIIKNKINYELDKTLCNIILFIQLDKKVAVFDLDETLVHCKKTDIKSADVTLDIKLESGKYVKVN